MCWFKLKSFNIGDPALIGLQCDHAAFPDCDLTNLSRKPSCDGHLIFSEDKETCGIQNCLQEGVMKKARNSIESGWTLPINGDILNNDKSTGDHENYFFYLENEQKSKTKVYDDRGFEYENCTKKAVYVRQKEEHNVWFSLSADYTFLFSNNTKYERSESISFQDKLSYSRTFGPDYG